MKLVGNDRKMNIIRRDNEFWMMMQRFTLLWSGSRYIVFLLQVVLQHEKEDEHLS